MARNLRDTPFSLERLPVWALGIVMLIAVLTIAILSVLQITIPPQLQSIAMFTLGVFANRITRGTEKHDE